ncbi:MAG: DUF2244 domain-containing protein [Pseudomonadota bacterium]
MSETAPHTPQTAEHRPEFDAVLTANRSLGPRGFLILMAIISVVSFAAGLYFTALGAWPVFGFFGLDALLIYGAFKLNYRAARQHERVTLMGTELVVSEMLASGRVRTARLPAYWVRVGLEELSQERARLVLRIYGNEYPLGRHLTDDEKRSFAEALSHALAAFRNSRPAPV